MLKKSFSLLTSSLVISGLTANVASAHCPLCTIGAGAVALGAVSLGLSVFSVGIFLGAFGLAMGLWVGRLVAARVYLWRYQTYLIGLASFILTIWPLEKLFYDASSVYISLTDEYGSWLNRTYYIDKFLAGSIIGAIILLLSPSISRKLTGMRKGKMLSSYQGILITFGLLTFASAIFEITRWLTPSL